MYVCMSASVSVSMFVAVASDLSMSVCVCVCMFVCLFASRSDVLELSVADLDGYMRDFPQVCLFLGLFYRSLSWVCLHVYKYYVT